MQNRTIHYDLWKIINLEMKGELTRQDFQSFVRQVKRAHYPNGNSNEILYQMKDSIDKLRDKLIDSIMEEMENSSAEHEPNNVIHPNLNDLLDIKDVIVKFGISRPTLYKWEKDGLKRTQIGGRVFFRISDLNRFTNHSDDNSTH